MAKKILTKDTNIHFPHFTVLKASAGSGKTYALTERFVQFVLSDTIPTNSLRNILAITFTNNTAKEMKERILTWLKSVYFNRSEQVTELSRILSLDREKMIEKAGHILEELLVNYSDFQVKTIDSFMTTVFKTSALDFGYNPDFDILVNNDYVMNYAFDLFLRDVREGTAEAKLFENIISIIIQNKKKDAAYLWDPSSNLLEEITRIYQQLSSSGKQPKIESFSSEIDTIKNKIKNTVETIEDQIIKSGLDKRKNSSYMTIRSLVQEGRFVDIIGRGMNNPPVNKPKINQTAHQASYNRISEMWTELGQLISQFTYYHAHSYYTPYMSVYQVFRHVIETLKKQHGKVFIEDINWNLAGYLDSEIVPDVYFRLGETIFHFLIDEFQDTSPIQWKNLFPLIENSLSQKGSAFVVGDTKQAIYGFRHADYTIMKALEKQNPFPSALHRVQELDTNYRSFEKILTFNEKVFKDIVANSEEYSEAGSMSGLTDYVQDVRARHEKSGYVEVTIMEKDDEAPPEKQKIQDIVCELLSRGYTYGDIAILTQRNEDAVRTTSWLNERNIPFVSYSSLDIRRRKITGEIVALLRFLSSPTDDLSFTTFILGDLFSRTLDQSACSIQREQLQDFCFKFRSVPPLYKSFQEHFRDLWETYFATLFKLSGYLPLYDLVTHLFSVYRVFEVFAYEEATLIKILDVVKDFEGEGYNSIRDFLDFAGDGETSEAQWNMDIPKDMDALKVMTIHKAKGLGFPVVIVLLYGERQRGFQYIVREEQNKVSLLRITRDTLQSNTSFEPLYTEELIKEKVNRLNTLYVGFTRPREELYVIGVKGKTKIYPFTILPESDFPPSQKPVKITPMPAQQIDAYPIRHHHKQIVFQARHEEIMHIDERQRGEFIHRALFFVEYIDKKLDKLLSEIIMTVNNEMASSYSEMEIIKTIKELIEHGTMVEFFQKKPGRTIMREQEFSDTKGNLFRLDRVILDTDKVTVIDYKTGHDRDADDAHKIQIKTYMKILREVYPGTPVEGIIAYIDTKEIRSVV
jgi:ATP-dependent exoDNAse (exonuclease V) beta subunit